MANKPLLGTFEAFGHTAPAAALASVSIPPFPACIQSNETIYGVAIAQRTWFLGVTHIQREWNGISICTPLKPSQTKPYSCASGKLGGQPELQHSELLRAPALEFWGEPAYCDQ